MSRSPLRFLFLLALTWVPNAHSAAEDDFCRNVQMYSTRVPGGDFLKVCRESAKQMAAAVAKAQTVKLEMQKVSVGQGQGELVAGAADLSASGAMTHEQRQKIATEAFNEFQAVVSKTEKKWPS